jgi:hypothetical protein
MSLPVAFRALAEEEYISAITYYETQQPGLGTEFEAEVQAVLDTIAN